MIAAIQAYEPGKPIEEVERELGLCDVLKLASNENPLGCSLLAQKAISSYLPQCHYYPDGSGHVLKHALAARLDVTPVELMLGNGSTELIDLLIRTFCTEAHEVLAPACTFPCYRLMAQARSIPYVHARRGQALGYDIPALLEAVTPRTRVVFVASPDNPTGVYLNAQALERLVRELRHDILLVIDAAYHEYVTAQDYRDPLALRHERERLVVLRSFSKVYGLAGVRCGYGIASPEIASYVNRVRTPFNVSSLALVGARAALDDIDHVARSLACNREGLATLTAALARLGIDFIPSQANFILVDVSPRHGREIYETLLRRGIVVRPLGSYGLPHHLRITVGTASQNQRLLSELAVVLCP